MARPQKRTDEKRSATLRFRATLAERAYVRTQAHAAGLTPSEYCRARALGYQVPVASRQNTSPALISELNSIGNNVNQLARSVHRGSGFQEYWKEIGAELGAVLAKVVNRHDP